jgi:hypothetical protein
MDVAAVPPTPLLILHHARDLGEKTAIPALVNVRARPMLVPALTDQDAPARHQLAGESFHASPLALAVTPVPGAPNTFFVCHVPDLLPPCCFLFPETCLKQPPGFPLVLQLTSSVTYLLWTGFTGLTG